MNNLGEQILRKFLDTTIKYCLEKVKAGQACNISEYENSLNVL